MHALSIAWYERALRQRLAGVTLMALAAAIGVGLAYKSPNPSWTGAFAAVGVFAISAWMVTSARTHLTLALLMLYLGLADGFLKETTGSSTATLGRDLLLYSIVIGVLIKRMVRREPFSAPPLTGWIIALIAVVTVQLFNPADLSLSHSLASMRPHLEFVPLFFLGYTMMRSRRRLKGFLILLLAVGALNGVVGLIQFSLTPAQLASWGPGYAARINGTGGVSSRAYVDTTGQTRTRPFALGSDEGFGGLVGYLAAPAALALLSLAGNRKLKIPAGVLSAGVLLAVVTSQARVALVSTAVAILAFVLLATSSRRLFRLVTGLAIGVALAYGVISTVTAQSNAHLFDRYSSITPGNVLSTSYSYRSDTYAKVLPSYLVKYPLGAGIGKTGPAANSAGARGGSGLDAESEPTYLLVELGIPGLVLLLGFQVRMVGMSLRIRRLWDMELRLLLAALAAPLFAMLIGGWVASTTATTPQAPYLWFVSGILTYWLIGSRRELDDVKRGP